MSVDPFLVPVGFYCGPFFVDPERDPEYWQVRVGRETYELPNVDALNMWFQARGVATGGEETDHSRPAVVAAAKDLGMREPDYVLDRLIESRLIIEVGSDEWPIERFADAYTLQPLMVGIGNAPEQTGEYRLGLDPAHVYAGLTAEQYDAWVFTHLSRSFRHAAQENVRSLDDARTRGELERLCRVSAGLLARSAAYVDVVVGTEVQAGGPRQREGAIQPGVPPIPPLPPDAALDRSAAGPDDPDGDDADDYDF